MYLGIRMMFAGFLMLGLATFFVLDSFVGEIRPSVGEATEELMVDAANLLAELAADDLASGRIADGAFAAAARSYRKRPLNAAIQGIAKETLDFRVLVTDRQGVVRFDSEGSDIGEDYSRWRDVALTLRGEYGARASRQQTSPYGPPVYYVSAPIQGTATAANAPRPLLGVLTVAKSMDTIEPYIQRSQDRVMRSGGWLLFWSLLIGVVITLWTVYEVRRLAHYAEAVDAGKRVAVPEVRGELGKLARAMASMRSRLEGQQYVERYVTALTHELKSPLAAVRASGELLREPMADADRERFAGHVVSQSERMQRSVDRLLALTRLEQTQRLDAARAGDLRAFAREVTDALRPRAEAADVHLFVRDDDAAVVANFDPELMTLALTNLVENAIAFSPRESRVEIAVALAADGQCAEVCVVDEGAGVDTGVLGRIGERFVSTPRPDGSPRSSGLGLAIVTQIMALHGGSVALENLARGARATLRIPV